MNSGKCPDNLIWTFCVLCVSHVKQQQELVRVRLDHNNGKLWVIWTLSGVCHLGADRKNSDFDICIVTYSSSG